MEKGTLWAKRVVIRLVAHTESLPGTECEFGTPLGRYTSKGQMLIFHNSLGLSPYLREKLVERLKQMETESKR